VDLALSRHGLGPVLVAVVAAGAGATREAGGAVAPRDYAACEAPTREGGERYAAGRDGYQVGLSTSSIKNLLEVWCPY
jgi:hypothetical protein